METLLRAPEPLEVNGDLSENWKNFKSAFETFAIASGIEDKVSSRKAAVLTNLMGEEAKRNLFPVIDIKAEDQKDYEKLVAALEKYCVAKANLLYSRHQFYSRKQEEGEPFDNFWRELKRMVTACQFTDMSVLRDRVVFGTNDEELKEHCIKKGDIKLEDVVDKARIRERTKKEALEVLENRCVHMMNGQRKSEQTSNGQNNQVTQNNQNDNQFQCFRCHTSQGPRECPAFIMLVCIKQVQK